MNTIQMTLDTDALTLLDRAKRIKQSLNDGARHIDWIHFQHDSADIRAKRVQQFAGEHTDAHVIAIDDFKGHFADAEAIIDTLEISLNAPLGQPKTIATSSYMSNVDYCQSLINNLGCDVNTQLTIACILNHILSEK